MQKQGYSLFFLSGCFQNAYIFFFPNSFYTLFTKESHIPSVSCTEKALCFVIICPICCTIFVILPVFKASLFITKSNQILSLLDFFTSTTISMSSVLFFLFINNWQAHSICGIPVLQTFTAKAHPGENSGFRNRTILPYCNTVLLFLLDFTQVFPLGNLVWNSCFPSAGAKLMSSARVLLGPLLKWPVRFAV